MSSIRANLTARAREISQVLAAGVTTDGQYLSEPQVTINGEVISTDDFVRRLYDELARIKEILESNVLDDDGDGGPVWEVRVRVR